MFFSTIPALIERFAAKHVFETASPILASASFTLAAVYSAAKNWAMVNDIKSLIAANNVLRTDTENLRKSIDDSLAAEEKLAEGAKQIEEGAVIIWSDVHEIPKETLPLTVKFNATNNAVIVGLSAAVFCGTREEWNEDNQGWFTFSAIATLFTGTVLAISHIKTAHNLRAHINNLTTENKGLQQAAKVTYEYVQNLLKEKNQALIDSNNQLEGDNEKMTESQAALQTEYQALDASYTTLQTEYQDLETSHETLSNERDALRKDYRVLQGNYASLQADHKALGETHETLQTEHKVLGKTHATLEAGYKTLQNSHRTLQEEQTIMQTQISQLQQEFVQVRQQLSAASVEDLQQSGSNPGFFK